MKAEWFAKVNDQEYGPYTWQQMLQMAAEGRVPPDLPVKRTSDKKWFAARQVPGLVTPAPPAKAAASKKDDSQLKRARPLAAAAAAVPVPPPPPPPTPQSTAVAVESNSPWPVIVADVPKGRVSAAGPTAQPAEQVPPVKRNPWLAVGILASIAALVLLAGGIGIWAVWFRPPPADATPVAKAPAPETNTEEGGSTAEVKARSTKESEEQVTEPAATGPSKSELSAQEKMVKSISSWQSVAGIRSFGVSNASLQVTRVWRSTPSGEDSQQKEDVQQDKNHSYVCVEVTIRNKSSSPLRYKGWNSFGEWGAILADENDQVLPLVPVAKTPELRRHMRTSVPGGGSIKEVLVFAAPAGEEEVLHLVLPYAAFYSNVRPPYRAIELTPDFLGADLAAGNEAPPAVSPAEPAETSTATPPPTTADTPAAKAKGPGKPQSLRDMINSEPGSPAKPDDMPEKGDQGEKAKADGAKVESSDKSSKKGDKSEPAKKPENPFEPKSDTPPSSRPETPKGKDV